MEATLVFIRRSNDLEIHRSFEPNDGIYWIATTEDERFFEATEGGLKIFHGRTASVDTRRITDTVDPYLTPVVISNGA